MKTPRFKRGDIVKIRNFLNIPKYGIVNAIFNQEDEFVYKVLVAEILWLNLESAVRYGKFIKPEKLIKLELK